MSSTKTTYLRKSSEKSKSPKKSHGKMAGATKIKKDTRTNPHAKNKKATAGNPHGKSHKAGPKR